ncbi:MAG: hypothetical protein ACRDQ0_17610, partial [Pseudonocardia sp.]
MKATTAGASVLVASLLASSLAGCATTTADAAPAERPGAGGRVETRTAEKVLQVSEVHDETGMTLLEGPTFGEDGRLYLVDVTAPAGEPQVMAIDLATGDVDPVLTDGSGAYTSAQFGPHDGRLYLTDYAGGRIVSITPDGKDPQVVAEGDVEGRAM